MLDELNTQALGLLAGKNVLLVRDIRYKKNIRVDFARFIRVLCNLIKNAWEAMPNGGILTLSTDLVDDQVVIRMPAGQD